MSVTGGGFLKSGRMGGSSAGGAPPVQPMKPMGPVPTAQEPQGPPPGMPPGPPQDAPQGFLRPQAQPAPEQAPSQGQSDVNDVASNALMILHDEEAGPAFEQMISQGPQGAGQAFVELYSQLRQGYDAQGMVIDGDKAGDAIAAVMGDIWQIGQATGGLKTPDDLATARQFAIESIMQQYPDVAEDMAALDQESQGQA